MTLGRRVRLALAAAAAAGVAAPLAWTLLPLPDGLLDPPPALSIALEDRHGLPLRVTRAGDGSRAAWTALGDMDPQLLQAFLAREDHRFHAHGGVDLRAAARALRQALQRRRVVSGASTITMQLARLLRPDGGGWRGKARQVLWALRLERHLDKQTILEQYLNRVPLGQGTVGIAAAAAYYFGADAGRLSLGQAATLAGIARAPSRDNPAVAPARAAAARAATLARMVTVGAVGPGHADRAGAEPLGAPAGAAPFLAPHFAARVLAWAEADGRPMRGTWRTTLDLPLQREVEAEVRHTVTLLADNEVQQAAAVVLDNATGGILAWVGAPDFFAAEAGQVDMVVSPRQSGSTLKPFLYGLAFERGYGPASVLPDVPRTYATATGPYQPRNYDRRFHGPVRAREALASSFNVPAVELTGRLGAAALLRTLHLAGLASLADGADHYGLGLALGNGDVTLLELANAYRGLAHLGVRRPVTWRADGEPAGGAVRFLEPAPAAAVLDILADAAARVPGFGLDTPFDFPWPVAVKTGTSRHYTDNWAVAVTGGFTAAVWVGNFSGRPMRRISGVTGAGPLLHRVVTDVARRHDPGVLPTPAASGATRVRVCRLSGGLATARCPGVEEWRLPGAAVEQPCSWHEPHGGVSLPPEYLAWAGSGARHDAVGPLPARVSNAPEPGRAVRILSPRNGDRYQIPPDVDPRFATVALQAAAGREDLPVRWWVDGRRTDAGRWPLSPGAHVIRAVGATGRADEVTIRVD